MTTTKKTISVRVLCTLLSLFLVLGLIPKLSLTAYADAGDIIPESDFLTFTAEEDGSAVTLMWNRGSNVKYNLDGVWQSYEKGRTINLNIGDSVRFRGKDTTFDNSNHFTITGKVAASGNVMSMRLDDDSRSQGLTEICFNSMFYRCSGLTKAPDLPETNLALACYMNMFAQCTGLTEAPALPATKLEDRCYYSMFLSCTGLTKAPDLPATELASYCYARMFYRCKGLTEAPDLLATELPPSCYNYMFSGCTGLEFAEEKTDKYWYEYKIPAEAENVGDDALTGMFQQVLGIDDTPEPGKSYWMKKSKPAPTVYAASVTEGDTTQYWATIDEAAGDWWNRGGGSKLTLLSDIEKEGSIVINGGTADTPKVLDLNGHGILNTKASDEGDPAIFIMENTFVEIQDSDPDAKHYVSIDDTGRATAVSDSSADGTVEVTGGYISGGYNAGYSNGGGIWVSSGSAVTMNGGNIIGNRAGLGGGVYVSENSSFTMNGGTITKNTAQVGGGVYFAGTLTENGGSLTGNTPDDKAHPHKFTYTADGAVITASCISGCPNSLDTNVQTLTINAPELTIEGGTGRADATVTASAGWTTEIGLAEVPEVVYYSGTTVLNAAPTTAGDYTAAITVGTGDNTATAELAYTITRKNKAEFAGYSLGLNNRIALNIYLDIRDDVLTEGSPVMRLTHYDPDNVIVDEVEITADSFVKDSNTGFYIFSIDVAAKEMADNIHCVLKNGEEILFEDDTSVKKAAKIYFNSANEKPLVEAMLNYGAYSQLYFGYNTDDLANDFSKDSEVQQFDTSVDDVTSIPYTCVEDAGCPIVFGQVNLVLESEVALNMYFTCTGEETITSVDLVKDLDGNPQGDVMFTEVGANKFKVTIYNIPAEYLGSEFTISINGKYSVTYSPMSYCNRIIQPQENGGSKNDAMRSLSCALYKYAQAAAAYTPAPEDD